MEHRTLEHWYLDKQGILLNWRNWRSQLPEMSNSAACEEVAVWWAFVPMVTKGLDPWRTDTWPDPWELVSKAEFTPSEQGLGMFYSLTLTGIECSLVMAIVADEKQPRLMVLLPDKRLLNYYDKRIISSEEANIQLLSVWSPQDLLSLIKV